MFVSRNQHTENMIHSHTKKKQNSSVVVRFSVHFEHTMKKHLLNGREWALHFDIIKKFAVIFPGIFSVSFSLFSSFCLRSMLKMLPATSFCKDKFWMILFFW